MEIGELGGGEMLRMPGWMQWGGEVEGVAQLVTWERVGGGRVMLAFDKFHWGDCSVSK